MPVMDGLEAARQINDLAPNTLMLMCTMHGGDELLKYAPTVGIREVLSTSDGLREHLLASLNKLHLERRDHPSISTSR